MRPTDGWTRAAVVRLVDPAQFSWTWTVLRTDWFTALDSARLGSARWRKRRTTRVEESSRRVVRRPGPPIRLFLLTAVVVTMVVLFSDSRLTSPWPVLQCVSCSTRRNARSSTVATAAATAGMYLQSALARSTSVLRASLPCRIHWTSYTFAKCIF